MTDVERAEELVAKAGFKRSPFERNDWEKDNPEHGTIDRVSIYRNWDPAEGTFKLSISGDVKDLPALLSPITPEQAEAAIKGAESPPDEDTVRDSDLPEDTTAAYLTGWREAIQTVRHEWARFLQSPQTTPKEGGNTQ